MLYVLHGEDTARISKKVKELTAALLLKRPDASFFLFDSDNWSLAACEELVHGQGLFEKKYIVVLKSADSKDMRDFILSHAAGLHTTDNIFIVAEGKLTKEILKKIEKYAGKVLEFELRDTAPKGTVFNVFSLADALLRRDRKSLWVLYATAKRAGIDDEQIFGILFWQIKALRAAQIAKSATDAGLNPFVFKKAKSFATLYSKEELTKISSSLVSLYHEARRGMSDFDTNLERFVLSI